MHLIMFASDHFGLKNTERALKTLCQVQLI